MARSSGQEALLGATAGALDKRSRRQKIFVRLIFNSFPGGNSQTEQIRPVSSSRMITNTFNRSTGPVTPQGKARSSQNALRHGLTAKTALLPTEDAETYKKHCQVFFERLVHRNEVERQLVQQLADIQWRLLRIPGLEAQLIDDLDMRELATLSLYEQRLLRTFEKTLAILKKLQAEIQPEQSKESSKEEFVCSKPSEMCSYCCTWRDGETVCETCGQKKMIPTPSLPEDYDVSRIPDAA